MVDFKLVIGDPKTKRCFKTELRAPDSEQLIGKKIGDKFRGELINLPGFEFEITGGSDKAGFPMHSDVQSGGKVRLLLDGTKQGYRPLKKFKGRKERKLVRGNTINSDIVQINCKIVKWGDIDLLQHFGVNLQKSESKIENPNKN
ncbi:MAG: 30S ribosomal protein S6e [Candidatus Nanoarchaeia archaeon]